MRFSKTAQITTIILIGLAIGVLQGRRHFDPVHFRDTNTVYFFSTIPNLFDQDFEYQLFKKTHTRIEQVLDIEKADLIFASKLDWTSLTDKKKINIEMISYNHPDFPLGSFAWRTWSSCSQDSEYLEIILWAKNRKTEDKEALNRMTDFLEASPYLNTLYSKSSLKSALRSSVIKSELSATQIRSLELKRIKLNLTREQFNKDFTSCESQSAPAPANHLRLKTKGKKTSSHN